MGSYYFYIDFEKVKLKLKGEILYFREYIDFNVIQLNERKKKLEDLLKLDISESPEYQNILEQIYIEEKLRLPAYFYHSTIVSLYSLLETHLNEICEIIINDIDFAFSLNELSEKNLIKKSRIILTKLANLDFDKYDKEWIYITTLQKLRNLIVHENAHLKTQEISKDIKRLIEKNGKIDFEKSSNPFFINNERLLTDFLNIIESFLTKVLLSLGEMEFSKFEKAKHKYDFLGTDDLPF